MRDPAVRRDLLASLVAILAILAIALALHAMLDRPNATIGALLLLMIVLVTATRARFRAAAAVSLAAMLAFNYFFLPPVQTFTIADPQNWVALFVFLAVATVGSELSSAARQQAHEAEARRREVSRLFELSRDILRTNDGESSRTGLARHVASRFGLASSAICIRDGERWTVFEGGGQPVNPSVAVLDRAFTGITAGESLPADAATDSITWSPLRLGAHPVGLLVTDRGAIDRGTLDAVSGLVVLAIERSDFLRERKAAERVAERAELASALLASIGHDLRTPLTAVRTAVANLHADAGSDADRRAAASLALAGIDRLSRLVADILDMARIDASAVTAAREWVTAADIIDAAVAQTGPAFNGRTLEVTADEAMLVHVDPRLTSSALVHLLENAARYGGDGPVAVGGRAEGGLTLTVRDHGPGLAPADLDRVFDRFYRGRGEGNGAGIGMGLAIARGLLAAEGGRVWAGNAAGGGAVFTISIPALVRPSIRELS
jgi:two-component system sensor histidine kinase KdpD